MLVTFNRGRMVAVFPECALTIFPLIEFLTGSSGNKLNCPWNAFPIAIIVEQEMNMLCGACDYVELDIPVPVFPAFSLAS